MKFDYTPQNVEYVMNLIRLNLSPDLLAERLVERNKTNPLYGHCKHASQALILLLNTDRLVLTSSANKSHLWVQDENKIYDVTASQFHFMGLIPPYEGGFPCQYNHTLKADLLVERVERTHHKLAQDPLRPLYTPLQ